MKIKTFYLNSTKEIIVKIVKEILVLFKVEINDANDTIFDYDELKIENIYNDVYGYQDASGVIIFYENVVTTKNTATAAQSEASTWYRLGTDGKYYTVDVYGNVTDTGTGYHYDTASNSMVAG